MSITQKRPRKEHNGRRKKGKPFVHHQVCKILMLEEASSGRFSLLLTCMKQYGTSTTAIVLHTVRRHETLVTSSSI